MCSGSLRSWARRGRFVVRHPRQSAAAGPDPRLQALLRALAAVADTLGPDVRAALDELQPKQQAKGEAPTAPGTEGTESHDVNMGGGGADEGGAGEKPPVAPADAASSACAAGASGRAAWGLFQIFQAMVRGGGTEKDARVLAAKKFRADIVANS